MYNTVGWYRIREVLNQKALLDMRQAKEIVKELVVGEGHGALFLALGIIALWLFPIPVVVYIFYILWLGYAEDQARRWLRKFLVTWPRLTVCAALCLGCVIGAWQLPNTDILAELHPINFTYLTLMLTGVWLFWLCVDAAKELRRWRRG